MTYKPIQFFRQSSMQLSGDNSTISVKVNIYIREGVFLWESAPPPTHICERSIKKTPSLLHVLMTIFMPHINHYPIGCPWEASFRGLHDNIHADNPDEHCGALHHVFQAVLL